MAVIAFKRTEISKNKTQKDPVPALEDLYFSESNADEKDFVFDVHSYRKGSSFENTDLIAIHWRSDKVYDLIAVEVKLGFSAQVVQQALSYTRFSHRALSGRPG